MQKNIAKHGQKSKTYKQHSKTWWKRHRDRTHLFVFMQKIIAIYGGFGFRTDSKNLASPPTCRKTRCICEFFTPRTVLQKRFLWENMYISLQFCCTTVVLTCSFVRRRGRPRPFSFREPSRSSFCCAGASKYWYFGAPDEGMLRRGCA